MLGVPLRVIRALEWQAFRSIASSLQSLPSMYSQQVFIAVVCQQKTEKPSKYDLRENFITSPIPCALETQLS